jgi:hypothetical protein
LYCFRYDPAAWGGRDRAWFHAALRAEGIPVSAGYTTPLYRMNAIVDERRKWADLARQAGRDVICPASPDDEALPVTERICGAQGNWFGQTLLLADDAAMADVATAFAKLRRAV